MERKIGEVFTYKSKTYQVVKSTTCIDCAFRKGKCSFIKSYIGQCASNTRTDKTSVIFKLINNMEIKDNQLIINIPEGMEVDIEHSDLSKGIIKFKKYNITLEDIYENQGKDTFITNIVNNNTHTYNKISAIATLLDIANYYNKGWKPDWNNNEELKYYIAFDCYYNIYRVLNLASIDGNIIYFAHEEDAQAVIDNPNFRDILDNIYKY